MIDMIKKIGIGDDLCECLKWPDEYRIISERKTDTRE